MDVSSAYHLIAKAIDSEHVAHGYLIAGGLRGMALDLTMKVLGKLFPGKTEDALKVHPDIHWLHPEKKTRIISCENIHEKLLDAMSVSSFAGGWKVGVIMGADRFHPAAANAFLKILEEPPRKTVFLLLTDASEQILPTIISRCQRVELPDAHERKLPEPWGTNVMGLLGDPALATPPYVDILNRADAADRLAGVLTELNEKAEEEVLAALDADSQDGVDLEKEEIKALVSSRYREYRREFLFSVMEFFAGRMRANPGVATYRNIELVERLAKLFDNNVPEHSALSFFMDSVDLSEKAK